MTEQHKEIIIKAIASQIMLTEQAITKGRDLIAGMKQHDLAEYIWQEIAVHAQLVTIRIKEAEVYRDVYTFLTEDGQILEESIEPPSTATIDDTEQVYNYIYNAVVVTFEGLIGAMIDGVLDSVSKAALRDILVTLELEGRIIQHRDRSDAPIKYMVTR